MNNESKYLERLVEAELDGQELPAPADEQQKVAFEQFKETQSIFKEVGAMSVKDDWKDEVWAKVEAADGDAATPEVEAPEDVEVPGDDATQEHDDGEEADGAANEDVEHSDSPSNEAVSRFRRFALLGGLCAAAAALLLVFAVQKAPNKELDDKMAVVTSKEAADEVPPEEVAAEQALAKTPEPATGTTTAAAEPDGRASAEMPTEGDVLAPAGEDLLTLSDEEMKNWAAFDAPAEKVVSAPYGLKRGDGDMKLGGLGTTGSGKGGGEGKSVGGDRPGLKSKDVSPKSERLDKAKRDGGDSLDSAKRPNGSDSGGWAGAPSRPRPRMTAGEVDDNAKFDEFKTFLRERNKFYLEPVDVSERLFVRILDEDNKPLANTEVDFKVGNEVVFTGKTYSDGWTLFHPRSVPASAQATEFGIEVRNGQMSHSYTLQRGDKERFEFRVPVKRVTPSRAKLDLVFLLDTTSSMADEIERLQQTIIGIADDVSKLGSNPEVRFGLVLYRDDSDEYISKVYPFESDVATFQQLLAQVEASGGGDLPERLEVGLHRSVNEMDWRADATRLVFMVADAAPHNRDQNEFSYSHDAMVAASKAIKVYPIASSGLSDDGEYVFRQIAQLTMARFIFLTYGASGTETPHDIAPNSFQPETLDKLVVRIVKEELAGLELE